MLIRLVLCLILLFDLIYGQAIFRALNVTTAGGGSITTGSVCANVVSAAINDTCDISGLTAGSTLFVVVNTGTGGITWGASACSDPVNGTYTQIDADPLSLASSADYYINNISGTALTGANQIVCAASGAADATISVVELKGANASAPLVTHGKGTATSGSTITSASISSSANNYIVSGAGNYYSPTGGGWAAGNPSGMAIITGTTKTTTDAHGNSTIEGFWDTSSYSSTSTISITSSGGAYGVILTAAFTQ